MNTVDKKTENITNINKLKIEERKRDINLKENNIKKNKISSNFKYALLSLIMITVIFGGGFLVGQNNEKSIFSGINSNASAYSNGPDLSEFMKVYSLLKEKYVSAGKDLPTEQEMIYGAISGLVDSLNDPYTVFLDPEENASFTQSIQGEFEGVGMEVSVKDELLTVIAPLKNTPAEKSGIRSGDVIISIDGISTQGIGIDEAVSMIKGPSGTGVKFQIVRENSENPITITVTRALINIPVIDYGPVDSEIYKIDLYNFSANSSQEFAKALREFTQSKRSKLILDLRGNPGGYLQSAVDISSWFLESGKVVVKESFGEDREEKMFRSLGYNIFNDNLEMVILIDNGSASASEIVAGALQHHGIAKLIGTNTFGKGSVQELINVNKETSLKVTIARWLTPGGKSISDGGLVPDIFIEDDLETIDSDEQLIEAIKYLRE